MSSTRQFINTFLVDQEGEVEGTVLSRLPYDRVDINASAPTTFSSNDVVRISFFHDFSKTMVTCASSAAFANSSVGL